MQDLFKNILSDVRVELSEEFDRNFERKAFFNKSWPNTHWPNNRGSLLMRSGRLRAGNRSTISAASIVFSNSQPYARLHNEGGTIVVTRKMIRFFWAMYHKAGGAARYAKGKRKLLLSSEAAQWKALALKKPGEVLRIQQRQFIGWHPTLKRRIETVFHSNMKEAEIYLKNNLKSRK